MAPTLTCCGQACALPKFVDLRGLLSFWLLWELRLGPLGGAQLADRLEWRRGSAVSPGTLYPALAKLEREGLVQKRRDGRETYYRLTRTGAEDVSCAAMYLRLVFQDVAAKPLLQIGRSPAPDPAPAKSSRGRSR